MLQRFQEEERVKMRHLCPLWNVVDLCVEYIRRGFSRFSLALKLASTTKTVSFCYFYLLYLLFYTNNTCDAVRNRISISCDLVNILLCHISAPNLASQATIGTGKFLLE